jgi:hypothetical protein
MDQTSWQTAGSFVQSLPSKMFVTMVSLDGTDTKLSKPAIDLAFFSTYPTQFMRPLDAADEAQAAIKSKMLLLPETTEIELQPFTQKELKDFVIGVSKTEACEDSVLEILQKQTDGMALYVDQTIRLWLETGVVAPKNNELVLLDKSKLQAAGKGGFASIVVSRFDRVSAELQIALKMAAVLGR